MLTRRAAAVGVSLLVLGSLTVSLPASAEESVYCPPLGGPCIVVVGTGGSNGTGGSGGTNGGGSGGGVYDERLGWNNPNDLCYYKVSEPQPSTSDPVWEGHTDGAIYVQSCIDFNGRLGVPLWVPRLMWLATPPPGFGAGPSPAVLAARAINDLAITGPEIGFAPSSTGAGLIGLPVWMWTAVTPQTWGPISATASVPGLSVTATARATQILWEMGDGHTVLCTSAGTAYSGAYGNSRSPTCGYVYAQPSRNQPGGRYTVTATTTWAIDWAGGGASGSLTVTRASTTTVQIDELQVVTS